MNEYTSADYANMILMYGQARCNGRAARRLYSIRFPNRPTPSHKIFGRVFRRLQETGTFTTNRVNCGVRRNRRTIRFEEEVLNRIEENQSTSSRSIAQNMHVNHVSVWQVLREQQLHAYHIQKVQALTPADFQPRLNFCHWFLQQCQLQANFPRFVLFTDEASFTREGIFNSRNNHVWAEENPHTIRSTRFQQKFSVNVWAGIIDGRLIGPHLLPNRLTGPIYLTFLQQVLPELLENVPLNIRQEMWLQHDGAPAHFSLVVQDHLNQQFGVRWIGRGGPIAWPPRSPDMTPLDFYLWGHMKSLVYETPVESEEDLVARILAAAQEIETTPGTFDRMYTNMLRRINACIATGGRNFEHLL